MSLSAVTFSLLLFSQALAAQSARPPQFVLLAFDGSLNLNFWRESRDYAKLMEQQGTPVKFTYFISGVYFLGKAAKSEYNAPKQGVGKSAIGWGGDHTDIGPRVTHLNRAFEEGHEIASHANGHFNASSLKWSVDDWMSEFKQFNHFIFNVFSINKFQPTQQQKLVFDKNSITGFRAPQLGITPGMWPALRDFGFEYDTSKTNTPTYWPQKDTFGLWQFPLAQLKIVGTGKKTLSMDFNFYVAQSGAVDDSKNKELYQEQMYNTYIQYFQNNYNGNRAPIHIGHHFSKWNGGAYWDAMKDFAEAVCGTPEVKCVTYQEYTAWLNSLDAATLAAYRKGQFEKSKPIQLGEFSDSETFNVKLADKGDDTIMVKHIVKNWDQLDGVTARISVNGDMLDRSEIKKSMVREMVEVGKSALITAHLFDSQGVEVARATQELTDVGSENENLSKEVFEDKAVTGDLPEAHASETIY